MYFDVHCWDNKHSDKYSRRTRTCSEGAEIQHESSSQGVVILPAGDARFEWGEAPIPSTQMEHMKAVTQFHGTESQSQQSLVPQLHVLSELGCFSGNACTVRDFKSTPKLKVLLCHVDIWFLNESTSRRCYWSSISSSWKWKTSSARTVWTCW